jgi:hypothetical protein
MPRLLSKRAIEVSGLKEIMDRVKAIANEVDGTGDRLWEISAEAAAMVRDEVESAARSVRTPSDVYRDLFSTAGKKQFSAGGTRTISQLAGIKLRGRSRPYAHAYREWRAKASFTRVRYRRKRKQFVSAGSVAQGQLLGMSLASMWERGTKRLRPRPFFAPAIRRVRPQLIEFLKSRLGGLIEEVAAK